MHNNTWKSTFEWGTKEEHRVLKVLSELKPDLDIKPMGGKDNPDGWSKVGGIEIKSYSTWYYHPSIETCCLKPYYKKSCWVTDDRTTLVIVNHQGWLHLYKAKYLRYHMENNTFPTYKANVSQGDGTKKLMEFISIRSVSELKDVIKNPIEEDRLRWNCKDITLKNPYMGSIKI